MNDYSPVLREAARNVRYMNIELNAGLLGKEPFALTVAKIEELVTRVGIGAVPNEVLLAIANIIDILSAGGPVDSGYTLAPEATRPMDIKTAMYLPSQVDTLRI